MALLIGDNFNYQGQKPNFERDRFDTLAEMKAYPETSLDDGHLSYCVEDDKHYVFNSSNTEDSTTGKWREFTSGISEISEATDSEYGGIKLGYTTSGRNYALEVDEDGKAYTNVPWTNTTYSNATQSTAGLMSASDKTKLDSFNGILYILTQDEYDALNTKDDSTLYVIKG